MNTMSAVSLGYFISSAIVDGTTALFLSPILAMPLMLVGGLYANATAMPIYITVFSYVSPIMYAFNNLVKLEFSNSSYPNAEPFIEFLGIERAYWTGILYLAILMISCQLLAVIFLKLLVGKFQ